LSALSQVLLKVSADRNWPNRFRVYANKYVGGAYGLMLLSFALSSLALRDMRASLAPVMGQLGSGYRKCIIYIRPGLWTCFVPR